MGMRKVLVIGPGGSGKSTVARRIGTRTGLPVIHLDTLFWKPGWVATPNDEWVRIVTELVARDEWVMDGNYGGTLDVRMRAADTIVLLDLPTAACLRGIVERRLRHRGRHRPDMTAGCNERITWEFVRWVMTYRKRRRPGVLRALERLASEKRVIVLTSRRDADRLVEELDAGSASR